VHHFQWASFSMGIFFGVHRKHFFKIASFLLSPLRKSALPSRRVLCLRVALLRIPRPRPTPLARSSFVCPHFVTPTRCAHPLADSPAPSWILARHVRHPPPSLCRLSSSPPLRPRYLCPRAPFWLPARRPRLAPAVCAATCTPPVLLLAPVPVR
jgi:hypothetical protein